MERRTSVRFQRIAHEQELLDALSRPETAILCGGTDLLIKMRAGSVRPQTLLDVTHLDSMHGISLHDGVLDIGAATPEADILRSSAVAEHAPLLTSALRSLGSVQIRNRGSLGGNLVNASPAADSAVPLLLYDAQLQIVEQGAERWIPVEGFITAPGRTALPPGAFVRTVRLPLRTGSMRTFYHKVGRRNALTIAIASVGVLADISGDRIPELRVAAGSVAPTPIRLRAVEDALAGATLDATTLERARVLACENVHPISDVRASADYRVRVVGDLLVRALASFAA